MYWASSESQPPPPPPQPTYVEERIPILARRRSSGEIEVLRWCSRARPRINTNSTSDSRPVNASPLSAVASDSNSESGSVITTSTTAARRNLSLPWTNRRLLPEYTAPVSPAWSTTSSSDDESSDEEEDGGGSSYGTFGTPNYNTFSSSSTYCNDTPSSSTGGDEGNDGIFLDSDNMMHPSDNQIPWLSLPHRSQLLILALCQISEQLVQSSVISYLYYYLSSLYTPDHLPLSPGMIAAQAGMLASNFLLFQVLASTFWDRMSDRIGRKPCVLIGLAGITISTLGFGFSESMGAAVFWSILGGALSGNVGVLRTMLTETFDEDRYQSRALLMFPMSQNVGIVAGALVGGLLADPAATWPGVWGGIGWATRWKFALPNIISAGILAVSWILVFLFLQETQEKRRSRRDWGIEVRRTVQGRIRKVYGSFKGKRKHLATPNDDLKSDYTTLTIPIPDDEEAALPSSSVSSSSFTKPTTSPPFHATLTLIALTLHTSAFPLLLVVFLSTPHPIGLDLPASTVGLAIAYMGLVALATQILQYPRLSPRYACCLVPLAYLLMPVLPYLSASGAVVALGLQAAGVMLARNVEVSEALLCARGVSVARVAGPVFGACVYALCDGGVWWVMAVLTAAGAWSAMFAKESGETGEDEEENRK